ncbi:NAD(P)-binding protein [Pyxidicoccus sp. MSG2]|uniref:NAD(P)-binding protein n=1 Tax=Pyxidicoccus sp. MSG2 TaxID=2996790 RepID=UPI002270F825|nr:NAD(P)-binding protein [Pyxidicoccus sp. MSG2]MCY1020328.1 NAD(P)-binding protein [Pyxidicoccus sp. MSG2]
MAEETEDQDPVASPVGLESPGRVHIYGAGIAGLTAAHELARRGFRVRVYEPAREYDERGRRASGPAVGGLARSQLVRATKGALGNFPREGAFTFNPRYQLRYAFTPGTTPDEGEIENPLSVKEFVVWRGFFNGPSPGTLQIRVPMTPGYGDFGSPDWRRYAERINRALAVQEFLHNATTSDERPSPHLSRERVVIMGEEEELLARELGAPLPPLQDKDELLLEVVHYLPGEHGFRFFPSYYRHLFSTMVETPILDEDNRPTGRRVFDNLIPSSFYGIAAKGRRIRFLRRAPSTRPVEMLQDLKDLVSSGYPLSDMVQFTLRIWRYMSTCSERRKADYEKVSWWEYLEGFEPETGVRRYTYSAAFKHDMQFAPRVLAAFDGTWGDARTNGNTLAQLYLNNVLPLPKTDGTLNGPTTSAWFRPWRRYLEESLGVEFREARLSRLELREDDRLVAWTRQGNRPEEEEDSFGPGRFGVDEPVDYYVVATDAVAAEQVTRGLPPLGVVEGLRGFTSLIPPNPRGSEPEQPRTPGVLPGSVPWDRFQTLTGIQFFFPSNVRLAEGYLYFLDAPWGLSAISSQQYWSTPPALEQDGFAAVLSVDIGNWYVTEPGMKSPSDCSRYEIAQEVWRQIRQATEQHQAPLPQVRQFGFMLPEPSWYHLDRYIRFGIDEATGKERPVDNQAPYLIPIMGDWERRPGTEPWDPLQPETVLELRLPQGLWQPPHGGYQVHWDKLVFAGTYLKTFTRMTTMESANESARHAVNAILDHYLTFTHSVEAEARARDLAGPASVPTVPEYGGQGTLTGSPEFRVTPVGEYCRIWDPEKYELPELEPLRELDAKLFAAGLPHVWDVLRLEPLALPLLSSFQPPGGGMEALKTFLERVREALGTLSNPPTPPPP